jgi:hypothetical protein
MALMPRNQPAKRPVVHGRQEQNIAGGTAIPLAWKSCITDTSLNAGVLF